MVTRPDLDCAVPPVWPLLCTGCTNLEASFGILSRLCARFFLLLTDITLTTTANTHQLSIFPIIIAAHLCGSAVQNLIVRREYLVFEPALAPSLTFSVVFPPPPSPDYPSSYPFAADSDASQNTSFKGSPGHHLRIMPAAYELRPGGDVKNKKQNMAELKLRRLTELNIRLKEDLERPRVKVSEAAMS
ncbi:guanine nucleotide-binding protein subunit gamma, other [[Emmonsia] crescens]|uniref:Guanine nucleotide-binding protein subunit gamma, other n=1 Tax=[Emmonsia] crescens TaxID=73230 RepID=A0A2B7ZJG4_9EURO|nr:guanine nucleotide-binding protein subunit gamma, other [Emmonsia crescens]